MAQNLVLAAFKLLGYNASDIPAHKQRAVLGDLLLASNTPASEELLQVMDRIQSSERALPPSVPLANTLWVSHGRTRVAVWFGDITSLEVDAIVNAANEEGLGCFQPQHKCIDSVLHRAAGPRLREACRVELVSRIDNRLSVGSNPLVTPGFFLPAKHVLHVTGPQLRSRETKPSLIEQRQLEACYTNCLDAAQERGLQSIAFCCISTGLFSYPPADACKVALGAVKKWLDVNKNKHGLGLIVFDVFTPHDNELYREHAPEVFGNSSGSLESQLS